MNCSSKVCSEYAGIGLRGAPFRDSLVGPPGWFVVKVNGSYWAICPSGTLSGESFVLKHKNTHRWGPQGDLIAEFPELESINIGVAFTSSTPNIWHVITHTPQKHHPTGGSECMIDPNHFNTYQTLGAPALRGTEEKTSGSL